MQGQRIDLTRVKLAGLAPAAPSTTLSPLALRNFTVSLWAFSFPRRQVALRLRNVTLHTSLAEVRAPDATRAC